MTTNDNLHITDLSRRLELLRPLVADASQLALSFFGHTHQRDKYDGSIVTEADGKTEQFLVDGLKRLFPNETIIGEELGCSEGDPRYVWSLDPIDGTAAYASRLPFWCVSVGLMIDRVPVLGIVSLPVLDELYYAYQGGGAYMESKRWGREQLHVDNDITKLNSNKQICIPSKLHNTFSIESIAKLRSFGSTAIHALLTARHDAIGAIMCPYQWDIAGAVPILLEAGGAVAELSGGPVDIQARIPRDDQKPSYIILGAPVYIDYLRNCLHKK